MLQYRRRNSKTTLIAQDFGEPSAMSMLTYCNWSYASEYHIDLNTLKNILRSFNEEYIPFYLRIFNETPRQVVEEFLEQYKILNSSLQNISNRLRDDGFRVKDFS
ncbi:MAG TPA: hypothetical protein EYG73_11850 [Arcobacter sp.]|nr:hypothetical protein [Arcobacter sp.]